MDALWAEARLAVELDSRFHDTPAARRKDARKEEALRAAGWTVVRYRWRDVVGGAASTAAALRAALATEDRSFHYRPAAVKSRSSLDP